MAKIAVIGLGYVGITTSVGLAKIGHEVLGFDIDTDRVTTLSLGTPPIHEAGLEKELETLLVRAALSFSSDLGRVAEFGAVFYFVCVPTPQDASGAANLSFVLSVAKDLASIAATNSVVVLKSTVPVGSGDRVKQAINRSDVHVASNPEFLREGTALADFMEPDRIVAGAQEASVSTRVLDLYQSIHSKSSGTAMLKAV
jgi:UDPglucose 6-dehydrogenase